MQYIISYICFVIINAYAFYYLFSPSQFVVKSPYSNEKWYFTGKELFIYLSFSCAIFAAIPSELLALRMLLWLIPMMLACVKHGVFISNIALLYSVYVIWLIIGLLYTSSFMFGLRNIAKYLLPFIYILLIPRLVLNHKLFHKIIYTIYIVFYIWIIYILLSRAGLYYLFYPIRGVFWYTPAIMDSYGVFFAIDIVIISLNNKNEYRWKCIVALILATLIPFTGYVVRTGILVIIVSLSAMVFFRYKFASLPYIGMIVILGVLLCLYYAPLHDKMFVATQTTNIQYSDFLNRDMIQGNGRFLLWERVIDTFFKPHPIIGSGTGTLQKYLYLNNLEFGGLNVAHCDYVQILCDSGIIGIVLYLIASISIITSCFRLYNNKRFSNECRYSAFIGGTSLCGILCAMLTDNVVNYSMITVSLPYAFYGFALGLKHLEMDVVRQSFSAS